MSHTTKKHIGAVLHAKGVTFRVWAPFASAVAVTGSFNNWGKQPMDSENDGYWTTEVKDAKAGQEYKFVITNGNNELYKNDPRSLQVTTNEGNSVIVDPDFDWGDQTFTAPSFNTQVLYEMHIGTFNRLDPATPGTFQSAMEKLDYLAELGVNMVELMPINSMSKDRGWGYAVDYIYAVETLYGGRRGLLEFVKAAHARGIGVILDVVYNHFGPDDKLDIWQYDGWNQDGKGGIYFYNDWRATTPWGETRPDYGRSEVQQYILDNVRLWLHDCKLDGLRLDSTIYLRNVDGHNNDPTTDIPEGWSLMQQINALTRKINPSAITIAEDIAYNEFITKPNTDGGAGFSAQWEVTLPSTLRGVLDAINDSDRQVTAIADVLQKRYNGDAFQRVVYSDSHDSAANGSQRLPEEIAPGHATNIYARKRSLLASAVVLTTPGIPMLLQGQEFLQDGSFNDWQALEWERAEQFSGIVKAHKHLIALRKNSDNISRGLTGQSVAIVQCDDSAKVLVYHRWDQGGPGDDVVTVVNFSNNVQADHTVPFPRPGTWRIRFNSSWKGYDADSKEVLTSDILIESNTGTLSIAPYSVLIFSQDS